VFSFPSSFETERTLFGIKSLEVVESRLAPPPRDRKTV
jgi:hypothetical protein